MRLYWNKLLHKDRTVEMGIFGKIHHENGLNLVQHAFIHKIGIFDVFYGNKLS